MNNDKWRLIGYSSQDAFTNMAIDEAVADSVSAGNAPPTLRFYGWSEVSVSIGAFQGIDGVNTGLCGELGIAVVRRPTGGRAILHGKRLRELTYSVSSPFGGFFTHSVLNNHKAINMAFFKAMRLMNLNVEVSGRKLKRGALTSNPACFAATSYSELSVNGKKLLGSAQKRLPGGILEQGSIPFSIDKELASKVFGLTGETGFLSSMEDLDAGITIASATEAITKTFGESFGVCLKEGPLTNAEIQLMDKLLEKYRSKEWTHRR